MYYYGSGYSAGGNSCCNSGYGYQAYPTYGYGCGCGNSGGFGYGAAIILVLFILLVIIIGTRNII